MTGFYTDLQTPYSGRGPGLSEITYGIITIPERIDDAQDLYQEIYQSGRNVHVYLDEEHIGCFQNAKRFWADLRTPYGVLLSDDVMLNEYSLDNIDRIAYHGEIDSVVSLIMGASFLSEYYNKYKFEPDSDIRYIITSRVWGIGVLAHRDFMKQMLSWAEKYVQYGNTVDDIVYASYAFFNGYDSYIANPPVIEHKNVDTYAGNEQWLKTDRQARYLLADKLYDWHRTSQSVIGEMEERPVDLNMHDRTFKVHRTKKHLYLYNLDIIDWKSDLRRLADGDI